MSAPGPAHGSVARTIQCGRCGAGIPVGELAPALPCPHCGHHQPLPPGLAAELQQYGQAVSRDLQRAQRQLEVAALHDAQAQRVRRPWQHYVLGLGLMGGLPTVIAIGGAIGFRAGLITPAQAPFISFVTIGAAMVGMVVYVVWYSVQGRGARSKQARAGGSTVACPSCGAAVGLAHGQALDRCPYCAAALMPSATVVQAGLDAARSMARQAELERQRKQRSLIASYHGFALSGLAQLFMVLAPMVLMTGVSAAVFSWQMATGEEPYSPGIFALWGLCVVLLGGLVFGARWTIRQRRALRSASATLARQLGGQPLGAVADTVKWLNSYWAGPYNNRYLAASDSYGGAWGVVDGYATLVELSRTQDRYRKPRVHLLVGAWFPGLSEGTQARPPAGTEAAVLEQALAQAGWRAAPSAGGLMLRADDGLVARMRKQPAELAQLAPVLRQAAQLTARLGGVPVAAS